MAHKNFNPPSPWGEGRSFFLPRPEVNTISIHPPRGGRDKPFRIPIRFGRFQSTLPVGGGTSMLSLQSGHHFISIHPPRGGRDPVPAGRIHLLPDFNPPSPWGEGLSSRLRPSHHTNFNPPSPWGEGPFAQTHICQSVDFNPPSPWGEGL